MHKIFGTDRIDRQFMPKPACAIAHTGNSIHCSHTHRMDQNKDSDQILRLLAPPDSSAWFFVICDKKQTLIYVFFYSIQPNINYLLSKLNILEGRHLFIFINNTTTIII